MSTINGISFQDPRNINLRGSVGGTGVIRFSPPITGQTNTNWATNPFTSTDYGLYINSAGNLVFSSLGSTTVLGAAGSGGGVPTWAQIYAGQSTFTLTGTTWTIDNNTGNNDVLTLTNSGAGSGSVLQFTNGGTGNDVDGTSNSWSVSKLGAALFLSVDSPTFQSTVGNVILKASGAGVVTIGANTNTITIAKAATFSSTITVTDGLSDLISTSNAAAALRVTNNTLTTFGATATANAGMVILRSTSVTTGILLRLQSTEATLTTGKYIEAYDVTGSAAVFSVAKAGATTILGSAFATAALTLTSGDIVVSSGKLLVTAASNAASMAVFTNNTATSASVFAVAGSGVFTGTTTTSFVTITPSGLTTGTALYVVAVGATTSVAVVDVITAGLTSGSAMRITSSTANFTTGGKLLELNSVAAVAGNHLTATTTGVYTGTGMILVTAGAATTGIMISVISTTGMTTGSLIRATTSTAGALATNGAISFTATGAFTSNSAVDGGFVEVKANSTTAGTIVNVVGSALTTGIALQISNGTSAITTGSLVRVTASGTGIIATNGIVSITHAGIYTSTATAGLLDVRATALVGAGTVVNLVSSAASQTAANILTITQSGATITAYTGTIAAFVGGFAGSSSTGTIIGVTAVSDTAGDALKITNNALTLGSGTLVNLVHGTSVIGAGSSMLRLTSTGVDTGTTTGTMIDIAATAATTGTLMLITAAALTTGSAMIMNLNGLTTGSGLKIAHTTSVIAAGGSLMRLSSTSIDTSTTTGVMLDLSNTASLAGTMVVHTYSALTTGIGESIVAAALTTGQALSITTAGAGLTGAGAAILVTANGGTSSNGLVQISGTGLTTGSAILVTLAAAALTTGAYFRANDGSTNVFQIGLNGHIKTAGTAPSIVVTTQAGITAAAIAASNTDVCGTITTTGTSTGATQLTITFTKAYAFAPKVFLSPANAAAGMPNTQYIVDSVTTTTFRITVAAGGTYAATPSWHYFVVESGSST